MTPHEQMIISALRYALPRRSYIMSNTDEYICDMLEGKVSDNFIHVCVQDIEDHYKEIERLSSNQDGMHNWKPLLEKLKSYANKLNK